MHNAQFNKYLKHIRIVYKHILYYIIHKDEEVIFGFFFWF